MGAAANTNANTVEAVWSAAQAVAEASATLEAAELGARWRAKVVVGTEVPLVSRRKYADPARHGLKAYVVPGKSVTLTATEERRLPVRDHHGKYLETAIELVHFVKQFKVGSLAERDSYNLTYVGRVRSITLKTVTVVEDEGTNHETVSRLSLYDFAHRNYDFDAHKAAQRNAEWMD